jgi:hypothetical protein
MSSRRKKLLIILGGTIGVSLIILAIFLAFLSQKYFYLTFQPGKVYTLETKYGPYSQKVLVGKILSIDYKNRLMTVGDQKDQQTVSVDKKAVFYLLQNKVSDKGKPASTRIIKLRGDQFPILKKDNEVQLTWIRQLDNKLVCYRVLKVVYE